MSGVLKLSSSARPATVPRAAAAPRRGIRLGRGLARAAVYEKRSAWICLRGTRRVRRLSATWSMKDPEPQ